MKPKVAVYIASSLDGYIAREDGSLDWLDQASKHVPKGEDCGFEDFMDSVEVLVMGRKTYEKVLSFGAWPYGETPVLVLTRRLQELPAKLSDTVSFSAESASELVVRLAGEGVKKIYLDGGLTIQRFLRLGLIDEITLTQIPVLLGGGIPLFGSLAKDIELKHLTTRTYDFGFVQTSYMIENGSKSMAGL